MVGAKVSGVQRVVEVAVEVSKRILLGEKFYSDNLFYGIKISRRSLGSA